MQSIKSFFLYLFDRSPGSAFSYYYLMMIIVAVLIIGGIVFSQVYKNRKKHDFAFKRLFKNTASRSVLLGVLLLVLTLIRYENIPYFSMRILLYISLLLVAYFIYKTIYAFKKDYPRERSNVIQNKTTKKVVTYSASKK